MKLTESHLRKIIKEELEQQISGDLPIFKNFRFKQLQKEYPRVLAYLKSKDPNAYGTMIEQLNNKNEQRLMGSNESLPYTDFVFSLFDAVEKVI